MIRASNTIDFAGLINTGISVLKDKLKPKATTGIVAQTANDFTPVKSTLPPWLIPVAIVGALLLFRKKIFK